MHIVGTNNGTQFVQSLLNILMHAHMLIDFIFFGERLCAFNLKNLLDLCLHKSCVTFMSLLIITKKTTYNLLAALLMSSLICK